MLILEILLLSVILYVKLGSSSDPQIDLYEIVDCPTDFSFSSIHSLYLPFVRH